MKMKTIRLIIITAVVVGFISALFCSGIKSFAASYKTQIKKLTDKMIEPEASLLTEDGIQEKNGTHKIKMTKDRMARLAAVNQKINDKDGIKEGEFGFYAYSISESELASNSKILFGKKLKKSDIKTKMPKSGAPLWGAIRESGKPILYYYQGESELDIAVRSTNIKKTKGGYTVTRKIYCGYWGNNDGKTSNYQVIYKVKKKAKSPLGYVIAGITVKYLTNNDSKADSGGYDSFYGIWCNASKNKSDAEKAAESLRKKGFDAEVFVTSDWENLNSEKWYVVSAGVYTSKEAADKDLEKVKKVYSGAYVKYSGKKK